MFNCDSCSCLLYLTSLVGILILLKFLVAKWKAMKLEKMFKRWDGIRTPKDVVIVHGFPPGLKTPSPSPFVLKVQTYLRMAGIKYENDTKDMWGPKGKVPWISVNGEHVADSQFILEFLAKKFEKNFSKNVDHKDLAVATVCRVLLEEHVLWGLAMERFIFGRRHMNKVLRIPFGFLIIPLYAKTIKSKAQSQGLGLHSESEIVHLITKDLKAISILLGNKKFICGDDPTEEDCGIFGILALISFATPESPYEKLFQGELKNLKEYCDRMKQKFWPDWDQQLLK